MTLTEELAWRPMTTRPDLRRVAAHPASVPNMEVQAIQGRERRFFSCPSTHHARPWWEAGDMRAIGHLGRE